MASFRSRSSLDFSGGRDRLDMPERVSLSSWGGLDCKPGHPKPQEGCGEKEQAMVSERIDRYCGMGDVCAGGVR